MDSALKTTSKYIRDFESLFVPIDVDQLRIKAQNGGLRYSQFRSLCWRYFLGCLPNDFDKWLASCTSSRQQYNHIRDKHSGSMRESLKLKPNDDQSRENHPSLSKYDCDHKNVFRTIERDVVRTFPDMEFFRQKEMQVILENILYNFASENRQLSYKQGMHELLATLLYVAHTDSQNCLINYEGEYANETIATLLDLKYLENDVYHLFSALMKSIETWYQNDEILIIPETEHIDRMTGIADKLPTSRKQVSSVLGQKLKMISENIVKVHDSGLYYHLEALQIAPQIYGIRWMRLIFGREFEFLDLLTVWDAIICDKNPMSLIDYVFASMLIKIRDQLVNGDYTECLNNLMRHQFKDVNYVIRLALYLRDPKNQSRPVQQLQVQQLPVRTSSRRNQSMSSSSLITKLSQQYISNRPQNNMHRYTSFELLPRNKPADRPRMSTESYEDLHSIVDYCWRLLSEQIDSLQRCLPKEKGLHSEDEIFVALAQLKKVRDVLKGSLKLEDELDSTSK